MGPSAASESLLPSRLTSSSTATVIPALRRWGYRHGVLHQRRGPGRAAPEDHPERVISFDPATWAWRWLDARTLQFRPSEPWPSLARFTVKADEKTTSLATLMAAPVETVPAENADGLEPLSEITLAFAEPLDVHALERMVGIELRPLPGVGAGSGRVLTRDEFEVKALERKSR